MCICPDAGLPYLITFQIEFEYATLSEEDIKILTISHWCLSGIPMIAYSSRLRKYRLDSLVPDDLPCFAINTHEMKCQVLHAA